MNNMTQSDMAPSHPREDTFLEMRRLGDAEIVVSDWAPQGYPRHFHLAAEALIVLNGSAQLVTPTAEVKLAAGDMACIYGFEPHRGVKVNESTARFCSVLFPRSARIPASPTSERIVRNDERIRAICENLVTWLNKVKSSDQIIDATDDSDVFDGAVHDAVSVAEERFDAVENSGLTTPPLKPWLRDAWHEFSKFGDEDDAIADVAARLGVSAPHLSKSFADHFGVSPQQFIIARRVEQARSSLMGKEPLAQIAIEHGFSDQSHYLRQFRRHYPMTPGVVRRKWVNGQKQDPSHRWKSVT